VAFLVLQSEKVNTELETESDNIIQIGDVIQVIEEQNNFEWERELMISVKVYSSQHHTM